MENFLSKKKGASIIDQDLTSFFLKDKNIKTIFHLSKSVDTKIWEVGGAIRDFLIGGVISDIDFVIINDGLSVIFCA